MLADQLQPSGSCHRDEPEEARYPGPAGTLRVRDTILPAATVTDGDSGLTRSGVTESAVEVRVSRRPGRAGADSESESLSLRAVW